MGFRLQLLVYSLMIVVVSCWKSKSTLETTERLISSQVIGQQATVDGNIPFLDAATLNSIKELTDKFIQNINTLLRQIDDDKYQFASSIRQSEISELFITQHCVGSQNYQQIKEYFLSRYHLLKLPVRAAIVELKDKVSEMTRSFILDRDSVDLRRGTCSIERSEDRCGNVSAPGLLNGSEQNAGLLVFPDKRHGVRLVGHLSTECPNGLFKCRSGKCILPEYVCDRQSDCPDGSDEMNDCVRVCHGKRCRNLNCISSNQICDGKDDCGDGTDEENCIMAVSSDGETSEKCKIENEKFLCSQKEDCISIKSVCDGKSECADDSDEGPNCNVTTGCDRCFAMGGACLRSPAGPLCLSSCPSGFVLEWQSGLCALKDSTDGKKAVYQKYSHSQLINKINILFRHFMNAFDLLKKYTNNEIYETTELLSKCIPAK